LPQRGPHSTPSHTMGTCNYILSSTNPLHLDRRLGMGCPAVGERGQVDLTRFFYFRRHSETQWYVLVSCRTLPSLCSRTKASGFTPTAVFALATPKSPCALHCSAPDAAICVLWLGSDSAGFCLQEFALTPYLSLACMASRIKRRLTACHGLIQCFSCGVGCSLPWCLS
jgi:hypothetical protein